jgi:hypothetical protein
MKKLIALFFVICSFTAFGQYTATQTIGSDSTLVKSKGALQGRIINWKFSDTTQANKERISQYPYAQIVAGNKLYVRDSTATKWITDIAKSYVDSVLIHNGATLDTLYYFINGNAVVGGYVGGRYYNKDQIDSIFTVTLQNYYTQTQVDSINTVNGVNNQTNHIISGGIVTWSGQGLKFYVPPTTYIINGKFYSSPLDSVTLDPASTLSRVDLFIVDTSGRAGKITGVADGNLLTPQVDPLAQLALTTGIRINPGDTIPSVNVTTVYNENLQYPNEWDTTREGAPTTINFNDNSNPQSGVKNIFISKYQDGSEFYFNTPAYYLQTTNATLSGWIYFKGKFVNNIYALLYNQSTNAVTNIITLPVNKNDSNQYQPFVLPLSSFNWTGNVDNKFNVVEFIMSGADSTNGLYLDNIQLQTGINSVPPPTDYSNKVDQVLNRNDSIFYVIKGVYYYSGFNAYQRSQTDSITAQLRSEITSAAGGGVISFNGRNGAVTPDSLDYSSAYYLKHIVDSLLALKQNISSAFSGSYNDLTNKPVTITNLSLGTVTSTSQAINNSNGTGVTLPSASISTAGLMTAGDKVLVNTITSKVAYADTAAMLSPYLRKANAFTKAQADLLYRPITYVPSWSEITGKPTFATVATTGSYTDLINQPTIPTNNNQLANGMGYITGLDTMSLLHTYDSSKYITPTALNNGLSTKSDSVTIKKVTLGTDTANITLNWINGVSYPRKDTVWTHSGGSGGSGGGITKLGTSPYGLVKPNDSTYYVDSSLLLTKLMAAATYLTPSNVNATYLKISDTTNKWIPKGSVFPTYVTKPILALNDSTLAFDSLNLTEIRYSLAARDTTKWTDTTLIDKKYLTDRINPIIAAVNTNTTNIAANTTAIAGKLSNITGLVTAGTNVTVTGSGTSGSPYVISSSGSSGGTTADSTITATAGQTSFTFSSVPASSNDYIIFINGNATTNFTTSGNVVTLGITDLLAGDKVRYKRIK